MNSDYKELLQVFADHEVRHVSKADLITAKSAVAREQDLKDIEEIRRAGL